MCVPQPEDRKPMFLTALYALIFYAAFGILVAGLAHKVWQYWRTPAPLKIPTTVTAPSSPGWAGRIVRIIFGCPPHHVPTSPATVSESMAVSDAAAAIRQRSK